MMYGSTTNKNIVVGRFPLRSEEIQKTKSGKLTTRRASVRGGPAAEVGARGDDRRKYARNRARAAIRAICEAMVRGVRDTEQQVFGAANEKVSSQCLPYPVLRKDADSAGHGARHRAL